MTTSRRVSAAAKASRNSHTPGKTKGGNCIRPKDFGLYTKGNPYKMRGGTANRYLNLSARYSGLNA